MAGAGLAVLAIALADLAHFSQGWVQFGYRFSNDFAPFAIILVALGIAAAAPLAARLVARVVLVVASVAGQRVGRASGAWRLGW